MPDSCARKRPLFVLNNPCGGGRRADQLHRTTESGSSRVLHLCISDSVPRFQNDEIAGVVAAREQASQSNTVWSHRCKFCAPCRNGYLGRSHSFGIIRRSRAVAGSPGRSASQSVRSASVGADGLTRPRTQGQEQDERRERGPSPGAMIAAK